MKHIPVLAAIALCLLLIYTLATEERRTQSKLIGITAKCNDGMYTSVKRGRGACSSHGGVNYWFDTGVPE